MPKVRSSIHSYQDCVWTVFHQYRLKRVGRLIHLLEHSGGARRDNLVEVMRMTINYKLITNIIDNVSFYEYEPVYK